MSLDSDQYDFFVSYARKDNVGGWITAFLEALLAEHRRFSGGRSLVPFFDKSDIRGLDDWRQRIFNDGLAKSRLFLAFISPNYFAREWCRREWRAWIDTEIAKHILSNGAAAIYIVEVPGLRGQGILSEQQVAQKVAELCRLPAPHGSFVDAAAPVIHQIRSRRQITDVQPFYTSGLDALRRQDVAKVLEQLARDLDERAGRVKKAADSETTVPPYNKKFSGRLDELLALRDRLKDDRAGVISGIGGLGGIGKTELAFTYAHAFASAYPGGRFLVPCEGKTSLHEAVFRLGDFFRGQISDEERKRPDTYFAAISDCLRKRLEEKGHILLVLDNVTDANVLTPGQTNDLAVLGPSLHLLATTRLPSPLGVKGNWLTLGQLAEADALDLLEKYRAFANDIERNAARKIVRRLGGFTLAVELVGAHLAAHPGVTCGQLADIIGLEDLEDPDVLSSGEGLRYDHDRRLSAVLGPVLAGLKPVERRAMEYAALLPPDHVALPWLKALVIADFPEIGQPARLTNPWDGLWRRLESLALFSRPEEESTEPRWMRVHRLVQTLVKREMSVEESAARRQAVESLVLKRDAELEKTTQWNEARWEIEPLDALANLWDETENPDAVWLLNQVNRRWYTLAEWSRAEPLMRRALAIDQASYGKEHPEVARDLSNLAALLQATNRLSEAEPLMRRALAIDEANYGKEHPRVATDLNNLAALLQATNRLSEAVPLMRRALAIDQASYGLEHPNVAIRLNNLAQLLQATNRLSEAEPLVRRALAIDEASYGKEHPDVARDLSNLAGLLKATSP
jgi:hypothetical protein